MIKKIVKISLISLFLILGFITIDKVNAETYTGQAIWPSEHISDIYIKKFRADGYIKWQQARFIRRSEDNKFVYCLQPYVEIDNNLPYYNIERQDFASVLNMTEEQWDRVSLLAYYGYGYDQNGYDHSAQKWYAITQVLIWRTVEPTSRIVFTDTLNGSEVSNKFASEIAELESLVANHYKRPSFNSTDLVLPLGQSVTLTDANEVLNQYKISSTENVKAVIEGNNIVLTATGIGNAKVNLSKNAKKYSEPPIVYYSNHSQNVMRVGYYDPIPANFSLKVVGGRVEINKVDSETKLSIGQGDGLLSNAVYGVFNTSNEKIAELTTDANGYAISNYLPSLGEFYLKEITPSKGYELDRNTYRFIVDENSLLASVEVYEKVIDSDVTIFKVHASDKTGILTPEPNVTFDIYLKSSNILYKSITTDKNGYATIHLPYGTWVFKQMNSTPNFEKVEDFEITINETTDENIYNLISNAEITARLKVIKVDKDTGDVIERSGIKFKIKSTATNEYICQTITYPSAKTICEYETDENGILITPYPLVSGKYKLEEVDQVIDGYLWNKESVEFEIGENSNLIKDSEYGILFETKFENQAVKGMIEIYKTGEKVKINNGTYLYDLSSLSGIKFGIYDHNDNLIKEIITDENGYAKVENLDLGKYTIKELSTKENYILDEKVYEVELKYKDQYTAVIEKKFDFINELKKGTLEFSKLDLINGDVIPNTKIEIYTEEDELVFSGITDENGMIIIKNLFVGKFYLLEKEPATGYVLNDEKVLFEIKENGEVVKASLKNAPIVGELHFTKIDISDGKVLPNTKIEIYTEEDELVFSGITDENGMIIIKELRYGKYYILEKEAPEGYVLNDEKMFFEIKENGEVVKATMVNEKVIIEVPNTFMNKDNTLLYIGSCLILLGIGAGSYVLIKKRKK